MSKTLSQAFPITALAAAVIGVWVFGLVDLNDQRSRW